MLDPCKYFEGVPSGCLLFHGVQNAANKSIGNRLKNMAVFSYSKEITIAVAGWRSLCLKHIADFFFKHKYELG